MSKSTYNKYPTISLDCQPDAVQDNWYKISLQLNKQLSNRSARRKIVVIECYPGVHEQEVLEGVTRHWTPTKIIQAADYYLSEDIIESLVYPDVTDDRIFGYMTRLKIDQFLDWEQIGSLRKALSSVDDAAILVIGTGASKVIEDPAVFVYADMARWEIQQRMRSGSIANLGSSQFDLEIARKYKRAYFVDWRIADRLKRDTWQRWDYILDTNRQSDPAMVEASVYREALRATVERPFRVVPFFDPGPWGGQWMRAVCDLDPEPVNFAWCFDCVPEENSLLHTFNGVLFETPALNVVFFESIPLLGERVFARFGAEFPIRFDFLDTMDGGNLSLQVHPLTEYIREHFGMFYTQDESYYLLEAGEDAVVYLGLKEGVAGEAMFDDLRKAQEGVAPFDADKYVAKWPAKKHDHFLIPAGTIHCSGTNCMVLEISATPYIFTFKLWDWGRLGLDGLPRPINIEHGEKVIQWDRTEKWVADQLINQIEVIHEQPGIKEELTGLHEFEFIETRRHWFTEPVIHHTEGSVNVLNLIEGDAIIVESPTHSFEPFEVHFAETFIVPAKVGTYSIRPVQSNPTKPLATIKALVRK
jgi:mannose-6-phosphate isomerase class I